MDTPMEMVMMTGACGEGGGASFSSLVYIGLGGPQQPPMPSLSPKEGSGTNLGEIGAKTRILEGFRCPRRAVRAGASAATVPSVVKGSGIFARVLGP